MYLMLISPYLSLRISKIGTKFNQFINKILLIIKANYYILEGNC